MLKRTLITRALIGAALFLLAPAATAQTPYPDYVQFVKQHGGLSNLTALFDRSFVPVAVRKIEGPTTVTAGEEVLFTAYANIDVATLPLRSAWDFGDGEKAKGLSARHRFTEPGTYTVTFTLANERSEDSTSLEVTVLPAEE